MGILPDVGVVDHAPRWLVAILLDGFSASPGWLVSNPREVLLGRSLIPLMHQQPLDLIGESVDTLISDLKNLYTQPGNTNRRHAVYVWSDWIRP